MSEAVAIITGAGRGIGRATAIELAGRGYALSLASRNDEELKETARLAHSPSPKSGRGSKRENDVLVCLTDVTDPAQVDRLVEKTLDRFGRIDCIINNAGLGLMRTIETITPQEWKAIVDTNLSSALYLSKAAWPVFVRQRHGVIVNVSSPAARDPFPGLGFYGVAKAGLNLLSLELAREGGPLGIKVHTISPGATETAMFRSAFSVEKFSPELTLDPADVARAIADCATGRLSHSSGDILYLRKGTI